ncbi:MAG: transglutaminase domain-containing protein [Eubacteriales bacterium]|nr:transglutaminase domain-containing protein [Eubacteriales bacterium]
MQAIGKKIMLVALLVASFVLLWQWKAPEQSTVSLAKTSVEAANELSAAWQEGQDTLLFHSQDIYEKQVYHLLQAGHPYLSTLTAATYQNGSLELTYEVLKREEQEKGLQAAREAGAQAAAEEKTITGKLKAIHDALIRSCVYTEEDSDRVQMAAGAVEDGKAVCAGYARAFSAMCDGAGLDVYYIEDDDMTHAWNAVRLYGETYFIDCTYDDPVPDQGQRVGDEYFMLTTEEFRQSHTWDEALYEAYLDSRYPADFAYIQRMQDLNLADTGLRAADTERAAEQAELDVLNAVLGTTVAKSVVYTQEDGTEMYMTCGELYRLGYEALWDEVDGRHRIEDLIDDYVVPPFPARKMGF